MKMFVEESGPAKIVYLTGSMTGGDDSDWTAQVTKLLDQAQGRVVLEMSGVNYVSSAGLGDLVRITALANSQGSRLVLACVTPFVEGVLKTTRLDKFFDVAKDVSAAMGT